MFKNLNRKKIQLYIHLFAISLVAIGMSFSKVLMSLGTILGLLNLLIEADFKNYWINIRSNSTLKWILLFISLHLIGFIWSTNYNYAINDIRTKSTILIIPLVLISKPIIKKHLNFILGIFIACVALSSMYNFLSYQHLIGKRDYLEIREMSLFGSHIRFSILIVISCTLLYHFTKNIQKINYKILATILLGWLLFYIFYSQVLTGILALLTALLIIAYTQLIGKYKVILFSFLSILLLLSIFLINFLKPNPIEKINFKKLPKYTKEGHLYKNDHTLIGYYDGKPINISICDLEIQREWKKLSIIPYEGRDSLNQRIRTTIIRYISSKNLSKDAEGIRKLTSDDVNAIEKGIANVNENKNGIIGRLYGLKYQLQNNEDPNGHSLLQRFEFWNTAFQIIERNWLIGVGTGDVQIAFNKQYSTNNTKLKYENRLRAHNSYLTSLVSFGIIGLIIFVGLLSVFVRNQIKNKNLNGLIFSMIFITTALIEDTLETQLGATIFAFFIAIYSMKNKIENQESV